MDMAAIAAPNRLLATRQNSLTEMIAEVHTSIQAAEINRQVITDG